MRFEWDEAKRQATLKSRNLDFADAVLFDWELALYRDDFTQTEERIQAIGYLRDAVVVIVYTMRGNTCRIISMRKAEPSERRQYERSGF